MSNLTQRLSTLSPKQLALVRRRMVERGVKASRLPIAPRHAPRDTFPLSFAQERLWFLYRMDPASTVYHLSSSIRMRGELATAALAAAFRSLVRRHESLRTCFLDTEDGPRQVVRSEADLPLPSVDLRRLPEQRREAECRRLARRQAQQPFDLARPPLLRCALVRLRDREHELFMTLQHIVSDGWSAGVLQRELRTCYEAAIAGADAALPPLPIQYGDFALWQREELEGEHLEQQLAWWRRQLEGAPALLELPTDRPRPAVQTTRGQRLEASFSPALTAGLRALGRACGTTTFATMLAAFQVLLVRLSGQRDLTVGTPAAGRERVETEGLIGFFISTLVLRTDLSPHGVSFRDAVQLAHRTLLEAREHQDVPFDRLVEELRPQRNLSYSPLFQVMVDALVAAPKPSADSSHGLVFSAQRDEVVEAMFDLCLDVAEAGGRVRMQLAYNTDLFDATTARRMLRALETLCAAAVEEPDRPIDRLPMLSPGERQALLVEWNDTAAALPPDRGLHQLIAERAARCPEAPAVAAFGGETVSYGELDRRSARLAAVLRCRGVGPGTLVGLALPRCPEQLVSVLAVLRAGGAYVPLDPSYPRQRLAWMLEDSAVRVLVTRESVAAALPASAAEVFLVEQALAEGGAAALAEPPFHAAQPAYVIYTSGSTGRPKGVPVAHRGVVSFALDAVRRYGLCAADRVLQFASLSFDVAAEEIFPTWLAGGCVMLYPRDAVASPRELAQVAARDALTVLDLPAAFWHQWVDELEAGEGTVPASVRLLIVGGERVAAQRLAAWHRRVGGRVRLAGAYGPTETTITSTVHEAGSGASAGAFGAVPIGRPVAGTRIYLLDRALRPVPLGARGELYIAGAGVVSGYLERPALTAQRFVPGPRGLARAGERFYRTGDLARTLGDGTLEFLGRADHQVKIRGFRVEPGEIEALVCQHPAVGEAAVVVAEDGDDRRLVAYVVPAAGAGELSTYELHSALGEQLPAYMVPAAFVPMEALPLTPSNKIDRIALERLAPLERRRTGPASAAPRTPNEELVAGIWAQLLGLGRVGVHDDFFALGGHSLLAVQVIARLRGTFGVEVSIRQLFQGPTVAALAAAVEALQAAGRGVETPPVRRRPAGEAPPLSYAQERLWFLDQLEPGSSAYNLPSAVRLTGALRPAVLERALGEVVRRHEALRTTFEAVGGEPRQRIAAPAPWSLPLVDLAALPAAAADAEVRRQASRDARRPFDLARGPLLRAVLLRRRAGEAASGGEHVLLLNLHHIVSDAWSTGILVREITTLYRAFAAGEASPLPELPVQVADFALWQRSWLAGDELERQLSYWRRRLQGAPAALELPTDRPRPPLQTFRGSHRSLHLGTALAGELVALCRRRGVTLFMALSAVFAALLGRLTGQRDVLLGSPIANRGRQEVEGLIGFFLNTLVLRLDLASESAAGPSFGELLERVRRTTLDAYGHQDLPFERLVEELAVERDLSRSPLFQVLLTVQRAAPAAPALPGVELALLPGELTTAKFDLSLLFEEGEQGIGAVVEYNTDLFDATTVERLTGHFRALAASLVGAPELPLAEHDLLSPAQRQALLVEWNDTAAPALPECLHALVAAQARRTPEAVAVEGTGERLSYRQLTEQAGRLARRLRTLGVERGARVAVSMPRGPRMVVALLGTLEAGAAYVPVDPAYPRERRAFMLEDAGVTVLLRAGAGDEEDSGGALVLDLAAPWQEIPGEPSEPLSSGVSPDDLSHVIYTSGSTGRPKGVAIRHRSSVAMVRWAQGMFSPAETAATLASTSISFDLSVYEIFLPLSRGGRVIVAESALELVELPAAAEVTLINTVPSAMRELLRMAAVPASVTTVNLAGEALPGALVDDIYAQTSVQRVYNLYGPSEDTTYSTWERVAPGQGSAPAIGRPLAGGRAYLLDAALKPVPPGAVGEICLAGAGLATGYLGRPALTAERFVPDPHTGDPRTGDPHTGDPFAGGRLYRTGDLGRTLADGRLAYLGRRDHQVKLRGFRIELGEIEAALARDPAVREAVVLVREDVPGDQRLVAYVVAAENGLATAQLRARLAQQLPDPMVPGIFVELTALPLTPNGKLDRRALPAPEGERPELAGAFERPRGELERTIAEVWQELLGVDRVGTRDNFFDLGGHSLLLVKVRARLVETLGEDVPVVDLFRYPTVAALAERLRPADAGAEHQLPGRARAQLRRASGLAAGSDIAIVGMAGRYPRAKSLEELWRNLEQGAESITFFSDEELLAAGVDRARLDQPGYVKACGMLEDVELFDAALFGVSPREAETMDPQQRIFLECAWEALEHAACDPETHGGAIGVYAGSGLNRYWQNLMANPEAAGSVGQMQVVVGNDKDFLPTRVSYKLNLKGPSVNVQTACSTSLVATHLACQGLLTGECDVALAGGVGLASHAPTGYLYEESGIDSPDGHCRSFDAGSRGTVASSGAGVVVLKRLADALADGDVVHAVIKGSAINNDGSLKVGFTAPSVEGQAQVIAEALAVAGVEPATVSYVEAHGTATALGDPIEVAALKEVFGSGPEKHCALGAIKSNIGHTDAAAGVAGLIKTVLALEHGKIPASLHFEEPNPELGLASSPFYVPTELEEWRRRGGAPRRAGVSSFGLGGTNAHAVLEEAPEPPASGVSRPWQLLVLSAASEASLDGAAGRLAAHLEAHPEEPLADVAHTLRAGRRQLPKRRFLICRETAEAAAALASRDPRRLLGGAAAGERPVAFLLSGVGDHYPHMGAGLYRGEPAFRAAFDRCAELLAPHLGEGLHAVLFPEAEPLEEASDAAAGPDLRRLLGRGGRRSAAAERLDRTLLAQPAVFAVEVALASLWREWGIEPQALIGYSLGELTAAHLAGVLSLEDAARLVAVRARLIEELPGGAMLAVPRSEEELAPRLGGELALAATNTPELCVVSGPRPAVAVLEEALAEEGLVTQRLAASHAFHSPMMRPIAERFAAEVRRARLSAPRIPYVSNVTGIWITAAEATDPEYWVRHLCGTVRFAEGLETLAASAEHVLLEVGPGQALATSARQHPALAGDRPVVTSLRDARDRQPDTAFLLGALGQLWAAGARVDWRGLVRHESRRRLALPTYAFDRRRYWLEPGGAPATAAPAPRPRGRAGDVTDFFYAPCWQLSDAAAAAGELPAGPVLLLTAAGDGELGERLAARLGEGGETVTRVVPGEAFARQGDGRYALPPGDRRAWGELCEALGPQALPAVVVHLWGVGGAVPEPVTPAASERLLEESFYSLLFLAQALAEAGHGEMRLLVVTSGAQAVAAGEAPLAERAASLGPVRALAQELDGLRCRHVDVTVPSAGEVAEELVDRLLEELAGEEPELAVAYRQGQRFSQSWGPLRLAPRHRRVPRLRRRGCYLVTGGLGGMGLVLARDLAERAAARLVLVGRTSLPERARWPEVLADGSDERAARRIREVQVIEAAGGEVMLAGADVADADAMAAVVAAARRRFGAIHGVVHAAGVAGGGLAQLKSRAAAARVLAPKVAGTRVLESLFAAGELDFLVLISSVTGILGGVGQIDYCAANAFLDAFAHARTASGRGLTVAVAYGIWREVGLAIDAEVPAQLAEEHRENLRQGLSSEEGVEAFSRLLDRGTVQAAVTPLDLPAMVRQSLALSRAQLVRGLERRRATSRHPRPALPNPYVAPEGETELAVAQLWGEHLGVEEVGRHDNFFQLGGDSLLATQVVSRLRGTFQVEISLQELFTSPTVAQQASRLEEGREGASELSEIEQALMDIAELSDADLEEAMRSELGEDIAAGKPAA